LAALVGDVDRGGADAARCACGRGGPLRIARERALHAVGDGRRYLADLLHDGRLGRVLRRATRSRRPAPFVATVAASAAFSAGAVFCAVSRSVFAAAFAPAPSAAVSGIIVTGSAAFSASPAACV
jgi:hypothetical protein